MHVLHTWTKIGPIFESGAERKKENNLQIHKITHTKTQAHELFELRKQNSIEFSH